jgi:uncharacterized protein YndB with AHSA1/START domain
MIDEQTHRASPKGAVTIENGRMQVVFRRSYRKPIEKVWAALTTPERLEDWFGAAAVDLRGGGSFRFNYPNGFSTEMAISRLEAPRALGWTWHLDGLDTSVLFELTPTKDGCDLILTHSNVDPNGNGGGIRAGWHAHLEGLADCLDGKATPWTVKEQREERFAPLYENTGA